MRKLPLLLALMLCTPLLACSDDDGPSPDTTVQPDAGPNPDTQPACPAPTAGPTDHEGEITADETWSADTGPHRINGHLTIRNGATVTIEPCVVVEIAADTRIWVGDQDETATLVAEGTQDQPIHFTSQGNGRWDNLRVEAPAEVHLAWVTLEQGGADTITYDGATIVAWGTNERPLTPTLRVQNVTLSGSAGFGLLMDRFSAFLPGSENLTITGSGAELADKKQPIYIQAQSLGGLPSGDYTGNAVDEILVNPRGDIESDVTIRDAGVPYHVDGVGTSGLFVRREYDNAALPVPTLTIEAGVTLLFDPDKTFDIGSDTINQLSPGALQIKGTAAAPVVITSAATTPAAGDWRGIVFKEPPQGATNAIDYARIEYAGGDCSCGGWGCPAVDGSGTALNLNAALLIYGWQPDSVFVSNTTFSHSAGWGVLRGWDGEAIDFTATNTFENIAYCDQSWNAAQNGSCPAEPYVCAP